MRYASSTIVLFLVYLMLTGNMEPANIVIGLLIGLGISLLMPRDVPLLFPLYRLPRFLWAAIRYLAVVIWDVVLGGIATARIVLDPKLPLKSGIIAIPYGSQSELGTAFSAHAITLSPGELVIEMDSDGIMYTHCLNVEATAAAAEEAQAKRRKLLSSMFE
ncbi:MAG: Na+/H+ antiporter subunit E [Anaerolineae bacterium]|jgi:multicomponent Na+:H+ antiporter subunit E|nr:Na+/H+ antiporter subunit E [Anaerolineae bacterium]